MHPKPDLLPATRDDLPELVGLIRELADYEKLAHLVVIDETRLGQELFGEGCRAEAMVCRAGGTAVGMAIYSHNFSTFLGRKGLYLEDLFVRPAARSSGVGSALMSALARIAVQRHYGRFEWSVLDWNEPALRFYTALGAKPQSEWTVQRLVNTPLYALADRWKHPLGKT